MSQNTEADRAPDAPEAPAAKKPRYLWLAGLLAFAALAATFALAPPATPPPSSAKPLMTDAQREEMIWRQEQQMDRGPISVFNPAASPNRTSPAK